MSAVTAGPAVLTPDQVLARVGDDLGCSRPMTVTAGRVRAYRDATGDRSEPGGVPGLLLLALLVPLTSAVLEVAGPDGAINHRVPSVRFGAPLPLGGRIRAAVTLRAARRRPLAHFEVTIAVRIRDDDGREVCAAEQVTLYTGVPGADGARR